MSRPRRVLGPIAAAWLLCQCGWMTAAPLVFWATASDAAVECTCAHGDHSTCPMHHAPKPGSRTCVMRSAGGGDVATLTTLLSVVGITPAPAAMTGLSPSAAVVPDRPSTASLRPQPPDPPPPRA